MSQNDLKLWWGSALTPVRAKTRSKWNLIILVSDDYNQYHSCTTLRINPWHFLLSNLYHHNVNMNHHIRFYRVRKHAIARPIMKMYQSHYHRHIRHVQKRVLHAFKRKNLEEDFRKTRFTVQLIRWKIDNSNFLDFCASSWIVEDY